MRALILVPCAALMAACTDFTAPQVVGLTLTAGQANYGIGSEAGFPVMTCLPNVTASATGLTDAVLGDGAIYFYTGIHRTVSTDTLPLSAADVKFLLGAGTVAHGRSSMHPVFVYDGLPFDFELAVHYSSAAATATRTARVRILCSPRPAADSSGPTVTFTTTTSHQPVAPGDTIYVSYDATSTQGLWESIVQSNGVASTLAAFPLAFANHDARTVAVPIPAGTPSGDVYVHLTIVDQAGYHVDRLVGAIGVVAP